MMLAVFAFIVALQACAAAPTSKIVGGTEAVRNSWPWQLSLQFNDGTGFRHICGASLLSEGYALTAAHCVLHSGAVASQFRVVAGEHNLADTMGNEQTIYVSTIIDHPQYDANAGGFPNDIALLKLSSLAVLNEFVKVAKLPTSTNTSYYDGLECYISGWGLTEGGNTNSLPDNLQEAQTTVISHSTCRNSLGITGLIYLNSNYHICIQTGYNGACNGDSGGPLVCPVNNEWELAGATSWGLQNCPVNSPTVYTRVSNYLTWIQSNMQ